MKEEEIRPKAVFDEFIRLARQDTEEFFSGETRFAINCPACDAKGKTAFEKNGFEYSHCPKCHTLYVDPRPPAGAFERYYTESRSSRFWATTFYKETSEARREKLWKPKAALIKGILDNYDAPPLLYDIGGGYGIFAEEMNRLGVRTVVIEPASHLASVCKAKGIDVIETFLEKLDSSRLERGEKTFVSFELFEHLHDPREFLKKVFSLMGSGDLLVLTTLSGAGVDIQALWEDSKSVMPPYHLNFLNPHSLKILVEHVGLEALEITTPGRLDMDILENNREFLKDRFWRTFVDLATDEQKEAMQQAIASSGWSSHMMVTCRKNAE
jgi:2-polyprenyl-3-methyl-5-hydroxy-6-metoxy-1,4-benzoquinol methylase